MSMDEHQVVKSCRTEDPVLGKGLDRSWETFCQSKTLARLDELVLYVIDFERVSPSLGESRYFTLNASTALRTSSNRCAK